MNDQRELQGRAILAAIRKVLYREWDPLDVCDVGPEDTYDNQIGRIYRLLVTAPARDEIAQELKKIQVELIGPDYSKEKKLYSIADMLMAIDTKLDS